VACREKEKGQPFGHYSTGRTFSAIPQSNIQTSPRLGIMLFALQHGSQIVARTCHHLVFQRARVNWWQPAEKLSHEQVFF